MSAMDRSEVLAAKAAELSKDLQAWAAEILGPGEQLVISFRVLDIPLIVQEDEMSILNLPYMEFFTVERLQAFEGSSATVTRAHNCLFYYRDDIREESKKDGEPTLRDFLAVVNVTELLRFPNVGRKSVTLIQRVLQDANLSLKDPSGYLARIK